MQSQYRYVRIESGPRRSQYLYLRQNPLLLAWLLYWYGKPLGFRGQGVKQTVGGLRRLLRSIIVLCCYQLRSRNADCIVELPVFGHLCMEAKRGYKVFDLRQQKVVKLFSPNTDLAVVGDEVILFVRAKEVAMAQLLFPGRDEDVADER